MKITYSIAQKPGNDANANTDHVAVLLGGDQLEVGNDVRVNDGSCSKSGVLFTLCDGGSEHEKALECAESCNSEFSVLLSNTEDVYSYEDTDAKSKLGEGLKRSNELLLQLAESEEGVEMVSSIGAFWICKDYGVFSQVGNIRIYRFNDGVLEQLTDDHSEAWELVKEGKITPEKVVVYPGNRVLTQVLGGKGKKQPKIAIQTCKIESGDCFMLTSDGVNHYLKDSNIESILNGAIDEDGVLQGAAAERILQKAVDANEGADHVSVIVLQVFPKTSRWAEMIRELEE